jgi:AcrR family transcriptional regulator
MATGRHRPKTAPIKRRRKNTGDLRARLIHSGLHLLERSGTSGLSLREVARHSGVSHMAPYSHFRSKAELLSAIAASGFHDYRQHLIDAAARGGSSPREQFRQTGLAYVEYAFHHPQLLRLMFGGVIPVRQQTEELRDARGRAFIDVASLATAAMEHGEFRRGDPAIAAFAAWSMVHGFSQLALGREMHDKLGAGSDMLLKHAAAVIGRLFEGLST